MPLAPAGRLLIPSLLVCAASASAQCFDLRSTVLTHPTGNFQERWNTGERFESKDWGDLFHFAPFSGLVQKNGQSWIPLRRSRKLVTYSVSDGFKLKNGKTRPRNYRPPYEPVPPNAIRDPNDRDEESWELTREGVLTYRHFARRDRPGISERRAGVRGTATAEARATLNLNTGAYEATVRFRGKGYYPDLHPPSGVEIDRTHSMTARASVRPTSCPVSVRPASLRIGDPVPEEEMIYPPPCVVKVSEFTGQGSTAVPTKWTFALNPAKASSYGGCLLAFANATADAPSLQVASQKSSLSEGSRR